MLIDSSKMEFNTIKNANSIIDDVKDNISLFIGIGGYEKRSTYFYEYAEKWGKKYNSTKCFVFDEFKELPQVRNSVEYFTDRKIDIVHIKYLDLQNALTIIHQTILNEIKKDKNINIDIDISSMPRGIYCSLIKILGPLLKIGDRLKLWYTPGEYVESEFPTAGISKLTRFSGKPSLKPQNRAHVLGLGFDAIRSDGLMTVLDPNYLVTFYSNPAINQNYVDRIIKDNRTVLERSKLVIPLDLFSFESSISKLISLVKGLMSDYEVVIIPDGPKPLVLLSSIIPDIIDKEGIICMHVNSNRKKIERFVDVKAIGDPIGVMFKKDNLVLEMNR